MSSARAARLIAAALLVLAIAAVQRLDHRLLPQFEVAPPVSLAFVGEVTEFAREATGLAHRPLPPAPDVQTDLAHVQGADVFVLFIESYGAASWERPEFQAVLTPARAQLTAAIRETGRGVVTAFVDSTTFGGESWLAHISLLSGTEVRDPDVNMRLMAERRDTMVTAFARRGYTTTAIMPGLLAAWPDGAFYGFDRIYGAPDLSYAGPPFGWWDVTDQFVIARMDELVIAPQPRKPAFVFLPTISTHAPFTPVPPYQPDWRRVLTATPYDDGPLMEAWSATPDWDESGAGLRAVDGLYPRHARRLPPPARRSRLRDGDPRRSSAAGPGQRRRRLVGRAGARGDRPAGGARRACASAASATGCVPAHPSVARMDTLMRVLLDAFGNTARSGLLSERPGSQLK